MTSFNNGYNITELVDQELNFEQLTIIQGGLTETIDPIIYLDIILKLGNAINKLLNWSI
tara:strand:+ start:260 stop:436 length:177 start_codon:yes stop_codon:yes gene_type:complete